MALGSQGEQASAAPPDSPFLPYAVNSPPSISWDSLQDRDLSRKAGVWEFLLLPSRSFLPPLSSPPSPPSLYFPSSNPLLLPLPFQNLPMATPCWTWCQTLGCKDGSVFTSDGRNLQSSWWRPTRKVADISIFVAGGLHGGTSGLRGEWLILCNTGVST